MNIKSVNSICHSEITRVSSKPFRLVVWKSKDAKSYTLSVEVEPDTSNAILLYDVYGLDLFSALEEFHRRCQKHGIEPVEKFVKAVSVINERCENCNRDTDMYVYGYWSTGKKLEFKQPTPGELLQMVNLSCSICRKRKK